jgi:hypothetical protein
VLAHRPDKHRKHRTQACSMDRLLA